MEITFKQYYDQVTETLSSWIEGFASSLPNMIAAFAVMAFFLVLSGPIARLSAKGIARLSESDAIARLFTSICRWAVIFTGVFIALGVLGLDKTVTSLLAGAGVIGIALGFAFQDMAANFIAGVGMGIRRPFALGDVVETNGFMGAVHQINLRNTVIETFSGQRVIVPNKDVFTNALTNFYSTGHRRIEIEVGISYDDDIEQASAAAKKAVSQFDFLAEDKDVEVIAHAFGASSIDLKVRYWIPYPGETGYMDAVHQGVVAIKKAFDSEGIDIPFPIRTLQLGEAESQLAEHLGESVAVAKSEHRVNGEAQSSAG